MKVLFAVSNEEISENIVKKYQREYKEIINIIQKCLLFQCNFKRITKRQNI